MTTRYLTSLKIATTQASHFKVQKKRRRNRLKRERGATIQQFWRPKSLKKIQMLSCKVLAPMTSLRKMNAHEKCLRIRTSL